MSRKIFYICEICQTVLEEHNCKAICLNCGRMCDCSDLPVMQANASIDDDGEVKPRRGSEQDFLPPLQPETPPAQKTEGDGAVDNLP